MAASIFSAIPYFTTDEPVIVGGDSRTYHLREATSSHGISDLDLDDPSEEDHNTFPILRCRACNKEITSDSLRIKIAGSHQHTFFNPVGIVYELGCFAKAPGCRALGDASGEFSWFAGYLWRIVVCSRCETHLGWRFESTAMDFYGLILPALRDGEG